MGHLDIRHINQQPQIMTNKNMNKLVQKKLCQRKLGQKKLGQKKLGFSLIELSIVILVIGILVIGITQGTRIIREAKLKSARALTSASPVAAIGNIVMWLESTSEKSLSDSERVNTAIGGTGTISTWNDINPQVSSSPNSATQITSDSRPRYITSAINGLPAVNFDGTNDFMSFDGTPLALSDYTVVIVEQRRSSKNSNYMIGGNGTQATNNILALGYRNNNQATFSQYGNDYNITVNTFSGLTPKVHIFKFNSSIGKFYSINGVSQTLSSGVNPVPNQGLLSYNNATIGRTENATSASFFGDIGEIIIFKRYLKSTETITITDYLKTKWGIK
jgi:prepilin-type N-terminal cleavage/methylation domain-containing protein